MAAFLILWLSLFVASAEAAYNPTPTPQATTVPPTPQPTPTRVPTATPIAFSTPGQFAMFGTPELQTWTGNACNSGQAVQGIDPDGSFTCLGVVSFTPTPRATDTPFATPTPAIYAVLSLPTCNGAAAGLRAFVNNATACVFNVAPSTGGSAFCSVFCDGSTWLEG